MFAQMTLVFIVVLQTLTTHVTVSHYLDTNVSKSNNNAQHQMTLFNHQRKLSSSTWIWNTGTYAISKYGSELLVNSYSSSEQRDPSLASFQNGGFVITWRSLGQDGSSYGVYAQLFDAASNRQGAEFQVNTHTNSDQGHPDVTTMANGNFAIVWRSNGQDNSYEIYGQLFERSGTALSAEFMVNTYTTKDQSFASIDSFEDNGFVVVWRSNGQDGSSMGVYGQLFDEVGNKQGAEFSANTRTKDNQQYAVVRTLLNGHFVVTWSSDGAQDSSGWGVYLQIFDATAQPVGSEFLVNTHTSSSQDHPSAEAVANGFVVTWQSKGQDGSGYGIYAQRFDNLGNKDGSEFRVTTRTSDAQSYPRVATLRDGNFVVAWQSLGQDSSSWGVYAQVFDEQASLVGTEFLVNTYTSGEQSNCAIASLSDGGFIITWMSAGQDGSSWGIYEQRFEVWQKTSTTRVPNSTGVETTQQTTPLDAAMNNKPVVANAISARYAYIDSVFEYYIPVNTFEDADDDDLTISVSLANGEDWPSWLFFVPDARKLTGSPSADDHGLLMIKLSASDGRGGTVSDIFSIVVAYVSTASPADKNGEDSIGSDVAVGHSLVEEVYYSPVFSVVSLLAVLLCVAGCVVVYCIRSRSKEQVVNAGQSVVSLSSIQPTTSQPTTNQPTTNQKTTTSRPYQQVATEEGISDESDDGECKREMIGISP